MPLVEEETEDSWKEAARRWLGRLNQTPVETINVLSTSYHKITQAWEVWKLRRSIPPFACKTASWAPKRLQLYRLAMARSVDSDGKLQQGYHFARYICFGGLLVIKTWLRLQEAVEMEGMHYRVRPAACNVYSISVAYTIPTSCGIRPICLINS